MTDLGALLYAESLLARESDGRAVARLATAWSWDHEGKILRLHLKSHVRMHDGKLLTAATVAEILKRSRNAGTLGFDYVTDVSAPDAATVVITLSQPDFFLLPELTALRIVEPGAPDVGTGAFKVVGKEPVFQTTAFDGYHGGKPAVSAVSIVPYETQRGAWTALMRNEVDAVQEVSRETVEFMNSSPNVVTYPTLQPFYIPLLLNHHHPVLKQVEVRRALNEAVNRDEIVSAAMRGRGRVADYPIWPLHWAYASPAARNRYSPDAARRRLDLAGFPVPGGTSRNDTRSRLTLRCLFLSEDAQYERIALILQRQLFDVGINLTLAPANLQTIGKSIQSRDYDTALIRVNSGRSLDYTYRFWHTARPESLVPGYTGVDSLLENLRKTTEDIQTRAAVTALVQKFDADVPAVFIAWAQVTRAIDSRFSVGESNKQDPLANIWQWRPAGMERK